MPFLHSAVFILPLLLMGKRQTGITALITGTTHQTIGITRPITGKTVPTIGITAPITGILRMGFMTTRATALAMKPNPLLGSPTFLITTVTALVTLLQETDHDDLRI